MYGDRLYRQVASALKISTSNVEMFPALTPGGAKMGYECLRALFPEATECFLLQGTRASSALETVEKGITVGGVSGLVTS